MTRNPYIIAIDPDVEKSGVCILTRESRSMELHSWTFPKIVQYLEYVNTHEITVVVEAGWSNQKSCFHAAKGKGVERIAKNVGANHQVGKLIVEMCRHYGIEVVEQPPLKKDWRGREGKITHEEIASFIPSFSRQSNQETRDAALIAWCYAGFPIRISSEMYVNRVMNRKSVKR